MKYDVTPNSPKGWLKKRTVFFVNETKRSVESSAANFLYVKTSSSKVVAEPFFM